MPKTKSNKEMNGNGNAPRADDDLPNARDYKPSAVLSPEMQELKEATAGAMQALRDEIKKYGPKPDFRH